MLGWFKTLSVVKKSLLVFGSVIAVSGIAGAASHPSTIPTSSVVNTPASVKSAVTATVNEDQVIPFESTTQQDSNLASGKSVVAVIGVNGAKTVTYKVTTENGVEISREKVSEVITFQPVTQVTKIGTYIAPAQPTCPNGTYVNTYGNTVCSPYPAPSTPAGATAQCVDGSYSFSQSRSGTCSHHGGVATWL